MRAIEPEEVDACSTSPFYNCPLSSIFDPDEPKTAVLLIVEDPHAPETHACCREPSRVIASDPETTSNVRVPSGDKASIPDASLPHTLVPQDPGDFDESSQSLLSRLYQPSRSSLIPLSSPPSLDFSPSTLLLLSLPPPPLEAPSLKLEDDILLSKAEACEMRSRRV